MNAKRADKIVKIYLLTITFLLAVGLFYLNNKIDKLTFSLGNSIVPNIETGDKIPAGCGPECKAAVDSSVASAIASLSAVKTTPQPTSRPVAPVSQSTTKSQTSYIPLAGPITTTSTDWVDVPGTDVSIDIANDYSKTAQVSWSAFLSVADSNGQAFARLYDATHGIGVDGSDISVTDNSALTQVASGNLNFWSGRNTYRVQIKSLNSFTVTFGSGRIRIAY